MDVGIKPLWLNGGVETALVAGFALTQLLLWKACSGLDEIKSSQGMLHLRV